MWVLACFIPINVRKRILTSLKIYDYRSLVSNPSLAIAIDTAMGWGSAGCVSVYDCQFSKYATHVCFVHVTCDLLFDVDSCLSILRPHRQQPRTESDHYLTHTYTTFSHTQEGTKAT